MLSRVPRHPGNVLNVVQLCNLQLEMKKGGSRDQKHDNYYEKLFVFDNNISWQRSTGPIALYFVNKCYPVFVLHASV